MKQYQLSRKDFLKSLGLGFSAFAFSEVTLSSCMDMVPEPQNVAEGDFITPLKIPANINGNMPLSAQNTFDSLQNTSKVSVLGYQNGILGPTIRIQQGSSVNIPFLNKMTDHTNIHWHGLVIPSEMDGHPNQMIMPNETFNFKFEVKQQAGTNWYHPHVHEETARQVTKGLAGLFIVESAEEKALNLPSGAFEIPLIIQDKRFNTDGTIQYNPNNQDIMGGFMGDNILINGTMKPFLEISTQYYRFRILNGSSARIYNLVLNNDDFFYIIGSDGCILPQPEKVNSLMLASGERADILIDFSKYNVGETIYLKNKTFDNMGEAQGYQSFNILAFKVNKAVIDSFKIPPTLIPLNKISGATRNRNFKLKMAMMNMNKGNMHKINGKTYQSDRIDETIDYGTTEIWEFDNSTGDEPHPMHIHAVQFQVLSRKGGRNMIFPHEKGWKDTILVAPKEKVQVIMKFEQKGEFVFHCHNLEHEDDGMMLNFEVK